jgi:1-acyl-sn-glycerol-3-phosphate acyltransferase
MLPPMALPGSSRTVLGFECAGVVLACGAGVHTFQPGDEVMAVAIGAFGSQVVTRAEMAVRKPAHLTFEQAATIPLAFVTAQYGLVHLAQLGRGERVLIHAATGGVGLAAVQIARRLGAEIFATAGSPEKRAHLQAMGIAHVMSSRSLDFADEVMAATHGEGVDVVLNSLAGDAIPRGLSILRPYGRFIELGKRDIYADSPIGMLPFDRNLSFSSVALERMCVDRPAQVGAMLREVTELIGQQSLEPLPHTAYDLDDTEHALRFLAQARHIGKVVLTTRQPAYRVAPWVERPLCRDDGAYVISGGLGGFGLAVARWLIGLGARHIVLLSRSGTPMPENQAAFEALRAMDAEIIVARADVTKEAELLQVLDDLRGRDVPIRGVVHGAMVLDDVLLPQLTQERLHAVLAPKIAGAWNLHRLTEQDTLDFFIMFSSAAAVLCTKGQGNYAAGNTFLDTLATHRRAMALPATTVNWGAIAEVGYVSRHDEVASRLQRQGMEAFAAHDALHWLEGVVRHGLPSVMAARVDWPRFSGLDPKTSLVKKTRRLSNLTTVAAGAAQGAGLEPSAWLPLLAAAPASEREALLVGHVVERVAKVLGTSARKVDAERPLTEMGVDSLMAVELQTVVDRDFGVNLPLTALLEGATVRQLSQRVLGGLDLDASPATPAGNEPASAPETSSAALVAAVPAAAAAPLTAVPLAAAAPVPALAEAPAPAPSSAPIAVSAAAGTPGVEAPRVVATVPDVPPPAAATASAVPAHGSADYAHLDYGRWSPLQRFSQRVIGALFRLLAPIEVQGLENIPDRGPVLLAVNHLSMLDVAVLLVMLPRRGVCMATDELRRFPWLRWFLDIGNTIYVQRGEADQEAIQSGLAVLRAGGLLGVAPEGRRSRTGGLIKGQYGTALLASEAPAPILPVVAFGQERILRDLARCRRGRVHVRIGKLMDASQGGRTAARLQHDTDRLMRALAALLPPEYRGVYADGIDP